MQIAMEGRVALEPAPNVTAKIRAQDGKGSLTFDKQTGRLVSSRGTQKTEMVIADEGQEIDQTTETNVGHDPRSREPSNDSVFLHLAEERAARHAEQPGGDALVAACFVECVDQPLPLVGDELGVPVFAGRGLGRVPLQAAEASGRARRSPEVLGGRLAAAPAAAEPTPEPRSADAAACGPAGAARAEGPRASRSVRQRARRPVRSCSRARGCFRASHRPPEPRRPPGPGA